MRVVVYGLWDGSSLRERGTHGDGLLRPRRRRFIAGYVDPSNLRDQRYELVWARVEGSE